MGGVSESVESRSPIVTERPLVRESKIKKPWPCPTRPGQGQASHPSNHIPRNLELDACRLFLLFPPVITHPAIRMSRAF